jgi:putative intracellular protease/amidase
MTASPECRQPLAWTDPAFSLEPFDLVFLPGGHEKSVRQVLDSPVLAAHLAAYYPLTAKPSRKAVVAVCHGVQVLAHAKHKNRQSIIRECDTTALPARFEQVAFWGTRAFLGDYYKTYGKGSVDVEKVVGSGVVLLLAGAGC